MARAALRDDLHAVHAQLTGQVLRATSADESARRADRGLGGRRRRRRRAGDRDAAPDLRRRRGRPGPDVGRAAGGAGAAGAAERGGTGRNRFARCRWPRPRLELTMSTSSRGARPRRPTACRRPLAVAAALLPAPARSCAGGHARLLAGRRRRCHRDPAGDQGPHRRPDHRPRDRHGAAAGPAGARRSACSRRR